MKLQQDPWTLVTDIAINVRVGNLNEVDAAEKLLAECTKILERKGRLVALTQTTKEYPPMLSASHVAEICGCNRSAAYEIMKQPHRPRWQNGSKVRLHRDLFLQQLEEEARAKGA